MHKIFKNAKEPLFGRSDSIIHLKPFTPSQIFRILNQHQKTSLQVLFNYYLITGGMPKYVELCLTNRAFNMDEIIGLILSTGSPFLDEGRMVLVEEFGKDYYMYFSILELIALGKTRRGEIESILQKNIGGYIDRLDKDHAVIRKYKPINAKPGSKLQRYQLKDPFLRFWFRFIYRNRTAIEEANFDYVKAVIHRSLSTYQGRILEDFFHDVFAESKQFNQIGTYWGRDGCNEIDLVAINDLEKRLVVAEIKLNKHKIDLGSLKEKATKLLPSYPGYHVAYLSLDLESAGQYLVGTL